MVMMQPFAWGYRCDRADVSENQINFVVQSQSRIMKRIGFFNLLIILGLAGCRQSVPTNEHEALATGMLEAFNRHDWKKMSEFYAEDADFLDPSFGKSYVKQSRAELAKKYAEMQKMFPDIRDDITDIHVAGETVIVQFTSRGTAVDGTYFELPIVSVLSFRDGLIVRDATYYDLENP